MRRSPNGLSGFTLIELFVVIIMIAILAGLLFPAFLGVQNQAKRAQAKNDLTQIVNAVNGYYTEYGKYPLTSGADVTFNGTAAGIVSGSSNAALIDILRNNTTGPNSATVTSWNLRAIVFIQPPDSKASNPGKAGIDPVATSPTYDVWFDPWGSAYNVTIDGAYSNSIANPYSTNAGAATLQIGVIAWSFGKDQQSQSLPGPAPDKSTGTNVDDLISWQ
jgi:type II secretory pathway pseudopilin PulG